MASGREISHISTGLFRTWEEIQRLGIHLQTVSSRHSITLCSAKLTTQEQILGQLKQNPDILQISCEFDLFSRGGSFLPPFFRELFKHRQVRHSLANRLAGMFETRVG